ncbi:MAG TPA: hypothetical protein VHN74_22515 [Candidatus Angelobacter sp.]|nr:hypothetical protein [Candidatus Angelobacter sp.]
MDLVLNLTNSTFQADQRPGRDPHPLPCLEVKAGFRSAETHGFPQRLYLRFRDDCRKTFKGDE